MKSQVAQWGNSLAVRIPRAHARKLGLVPGSPVDLDVRQDSLVVRKRAYRLDELLGQITDDNVHRDIDPGPPRGREIW
ncbi:MAG: AbrB/MazE/SpoVT family DNA-binding domain-containing protein [Rhodospirillaceae bacterium]|nr:AbrB/MazE/SpoVT family DNA-binding domain-containing protein [Rhodospirillaceae bacterium]